MTNNIINLLPKLKENGFVNRQVTEDELQDVALSAIKNIVAEFLTSTGGEACAVKDMTARVLETAGQLLGYLDSVGVVIENTEILENISRYRGLVGGYKGE